MFETLTDRLNQTFANLTRRGQLTESDVDTAMREVRRALLEADVNFKVVRDFVSSVRERAVGEEVLKSLSPAQTVIAIVNEELIRILGEEPVPLTSAPAGSPTIIMLVGLQGSGKTTHVGKLARHLRAQGRNPLMVAADVYRPAAVNQLQTLGNQLEIPVYQEGVNEKPLKIVRNALKHARDRGQDPILIDTAGRLQIDETMMAELEELEREIKPTEILLVADAMTGQEAVNVAEEFNRRLNITGLILTKMDGDARGGAALSIRSVTGIPIKFIGTGERLDALEQFYPDRLASRILGMGDVLSLIERAQQQVTEEEQAALEERLGEGQFDLEDFLDQLQRIKNMGPLSQLLEMIPGVGSMMRDQQVQVSEDEFKHIEAIIQSMTPQERRFPEIIKKSRRDRIARGAGVQPQDVRALIKQFSDMKQMMAQFGLMGGQQKGRKRGLMSRMPGALGQIGDAREMMKMMREQGIDPSQLGGMPGMSGGIPGMAPGDLEALMGGGQPLTKLNPRKSKREKRAGQQKKQRPARSKRRR
ncbi:MAG TPA: signal recognition particle protein [Thermomicrobiales bacterium]|nr:signal recognition particle protein [Thermomicrobiales bacterium]